MKHLLILLSFMFLYNCNSDNIFDCIQGEGNRIRQEIEIESFDQILVNRDIELILKQEQFHNVIVETGQNLLSGIKVEVIENQLQLTDDNTCNFVRDYGLTKIFVSAPNINQIIQSSQYDVSSDGVLNFPDLKITSEDFSLTNNFTVGDYRLELSCNNLEIISNNISSFFISGSTTNLTIGFFSGSGRFEADGLIAQNISLFHRGSNDMIVNPQLSLRGELRGTGDVISKNEPAIVEVEQFYTGTLLFQ
ncbi:DUF2807 domain-containing protein [Flavobacteriaceae bacterium]|nr:DUF2807 domain-containing protein [Flavobacteriaceae bacterium]